MTKHGMFGAPNLRQSKKITQPLVVMVETFRMSGQIHPFSEMAITFEPLHCVKNH